MSLFLMQIEIYNLTSVSSVPGLVCGCVTGLHDGAKLVFCCSVSV